MSSHVWPGQPVGNDPLPGAPSRFGGVTSTGHEADPGYSWAGQAPTRPMPPASSRSATASPAPGRMLWTLAGALAAVVALLAGAVVWWLGQGTSDRQQLADQFRTGRPVVSTPDLGFDGPTSVVGDVPDTPANTAAALGQVDAAIRTANEHLRDTADLLDAWAAGSATTREVTDATTRLGDEMSGLSSTLDAVADRSPQDLAAGLGRLSKAAIGYHEAMRALDDYLVSGGGGARVSFFIGTANANDDWDNGLRAAYGSAGMTPPRSAHAR